MKRGFVYLMVAWAVATAGPFSAGQTTAPSSAPRAPSVQARPLGVVTQIQPGSFTLHTDAAVDLLIQLPEGVTFLRVPPNAKDLKAATKINAGDISSGDRVLVRGRFSDDQKSVTANSVIVMSKADIASTREAERLDWQRRGIGGVVKSFNPATKEITIAAPNTPPLPGNPTHPVIIALGASASLLRYAPDSVRFSDAKPNNFDEIKIGDQVIALGDKSEDGSHLKAEKLISGTFRNLGATVVSVDAAQGTVTVKDLASGKPILVRTNADSKLHRLPPAVAQMIAMYNSGGQKPGQQDGADRGADGKDGPVAGGPARGAAGGKSGRAAGVRSGGARASGTSGVSGASDGGAIDRASVNGRSRGPGAGPEDGPSGPGGSTAGARDFNQMLDRTPVLALSELAAGDALIVVSTEGTKPSEVTAIILLAGAEPILAAQPKGSNVVVLPQWNMSSGGEGGQ